MNPLNHSKIELPGREPLFTRKGWTAFLVALLFVCLCVPLMNLMVPEGHWLHFSDYAVSLVGKIMCYAICALAMDLIWGYTGILSLGHGLFFAIGGYAMGMYLMRQIGTDGNYKSNLPDFMVFLDWKELPWHWALSDSFVATLLLIVLVPAVVSGVFGYFAFRSRIKGVYFSIITQAIRDAETRVMFSGYSPLPYKLSIWVISAVMCGVAGALYVPQVGIINPGEMSPANSIEIAVWAAVGGRGSLIGPVVGAFLVNGAKSWLTVTAPEFCLYFLGALFIAVTLFLPKGVVGLVQRLKGGRT